MQIDNDYPCRQNYATQATLSYTLHFLRSAGAAEQRAHVGALDASVLGAAKNAASRSARETRLISSFTRSPAIIDWQTRCVFSARNSGWMSEKVEDPAFQR
jgi:hypothetical protein